MISENQVTFADKLYGDPSGVTQVYKGTYSRKVGGIDSTFEVAIKCLTLQKQEQLGGMIQELLIQTKLEDCPFICKLYGYFQKGPQMYIISELLKHDLDKDMKQRQGRKYSEGELCSMLAQVVEALVYAKGKVCSM